MHISKHLLDSGVSHDVLDLGVGHSMGVPLLVVICTGMGSGVNQTDGPLIALLAVFVVRVHLHALLESFHCFVILFSLDVAATFPGPSLDEFRVKLDALLSIGKSADVLHQFEIGSTSVGVDGDTLGVAAETFCKLFQGTWEVALLE